MQKSHLERNITAILSACLFAFEDHNRERLFGTDNEKKYKEVKYSLLSLVGNMCRVQEGETQKDSIARVFYFAGGPSNVFETLNLELNDDVFKVFYQLSKIISNPDRILECGLCFQMSDQDFDVLFNKIQKDAGTDFNIRHFSLKKEIDRQKKDDGRMPFGGVRSKISFV